MIGGKIMVFSNRKQCFRYLSNLREGASGNQATIYFDDKNKKAIKIFSVVDHSLDSRKRKEGFYVDTKKKAAKIKELMKLRDRFPTALLPEEIITCEGKCLGYTMPMLDGYVSLQKFPFMSRRQTKDLKEIFVIACQLAELVKDLHSEGIILGDFHPDQFMVKDGKLYVCDTDTWGFDNKGEYYEADKDGIDEYIDPQSRDLSAKGIVVKKYTQESDLYSLAVVVFEMLVGSNPFEGIYTLAEEYDQPLRALNQISLIGNHDFKQLSSFKMKHVAWMSEGLQNDFMKIFEGGKRFNILTSLKNMEKDLKKCRKNHYYNSSRYSKCPICRAARDEDALEMFRQYNVMSISYGRYAVFHENEIRKVIDNSTYLDFNQNAIHCKSNGDTEKQGISTRTEEVIFIGEGNFVKIEKISRIKQFFYTLSGKFNSLYGKCTFSEKMKKCTDVDNPACEMEIFDKDGKKLYSDIILKKSSMLKVSGNYLFYFNGNNQLIRVHINVYDYAEKELITINDPFIYEINRDGDYCICSINNAGHLDVNLNGKQCKQLMQQVPRAINYDEASKKWCIINKKAGVKGYESYVIQNNKTLTKAFEHFSFGGFNIRNSIFFDSMLVIPADKRIIFLESGRTVEKSKVTEWNIGVVSKEDSKISISKDQRDGCTYLFIQNSTQVYKMRIR
jgi:serine/threonine protein kinase